MAGGLSWVPAPEAVAKAVRADALKDNEQFVALVSAVVGPSIVEGDSAEQIVAKLDAVWVWWQA